jgi:hypothetical protein
LKKGSFDEKFQLQQPKTIPNMSNVFAKSNSKTAKPIHLIGTGILQKEQNLIHKLELSVEKFSSIFSSANDAIIIIDSSTGIIQTVIQGI